MRAGWIGNTALQKLVQRADVGAHLILEAVRVAREAVHDTLSEWETVTVVSGQVHMLADGAIKILGTGETLASGAPTNTTDDAITDLDDKEPFEIVELEWLGSDYQYREITEVRARLDPNRDGTGQFVKTWVAQLFRVARWFLFLAEESPAAQIEPISAPVRVAAGSLVTDVTFTLRQDVTERVTIGDPAVDDTGINFWPSRPYTILMVWALAADGTAAPNVAWIGSAATSQVSTSSYVARRMSYTRVDSPTRGLHQGGAFIGTASFGMPIFELRSVSYAQAVVQFRAALGAAPVDEVRFVSQFHAWRGSSVATEARVPGAATWYEFADGDAAGADNRASGGKDLADLPVRDDYDIRVTLTPGPGGVSSPVVRRVGVEERDTIDLPGRAVVRTLSWSIDPLYLKAKIPELVVEVIRDGVRDYRDAITELLATTDVADIELRLWIGHEDPRVLARHNWLLLDAFVVEDVEPRGESVLLTAVSPLALLRRAVPAFDSAAGERKPVTYSAQPIQTVYEDLLHNHVALPARFRGQPPIDQTLVSRTLKESDGKDELDALAFIAGGSVISSQGRVKWVPVHLDVANDTRPHPVAMFPRERVRMEAAAPGYRQGIAEIFVPWGWIEPDDGQPRYIGESRAFNLPALQRLSQVTIDQPLRIDDRIAKWIPQTGTDAEGKPVSTLADAIGTRIVQTMGSGLIVTRFQAIDAHPELEPGDVVAVETDWFVARKPTSGAPVRGLIWLYGRVIAIDDPWGRDLTVWVPGYDWIEPSQVRIQRVNYAAPTVIDVSFVVHLIGAVDVTVKCNQDARSIRIAVSTSAYPTKTAVRAQTARALNADGLVTVVGVASLAPNEQLFASVLAYENADGTGAESATLFQAASNRRGIDTIDITDGAVTSSKIASAAVIAEKLTENARAFSTSIVFSAPTHDQVDWSTGSLKLADGTTYSISAGTTGVMAAGTLYYVYFDPSISTTAFQTTTDFAAATGERRLLLCVAKAAPASDQRAFFVPAVGVLGVNADNIAANSIQTAHLAAGSVTAAKIAAVSIQTLHLAAGAVTTEKLAAASITTEKLAAGSVTAAKLAANSVQTAHLTAGSVTADKVSIAHLSAISANLGTITAGLIQDSTATKGVLVSGTVPAGWDVYVNLSDVNQPFIRSTEFILARDGTLSTVRMNTGIAHFQGLQLLLGSPGLARIRFPAFIGGVDFPEAAYIETISPGGGINIVVDGNRAFRIGAGPTIGFYAATPIGQPTALIQTFASTDRTHAARTALIITDGTGGTPSTTIGATPANYVQSYFANALASILAQLNNLRDDQRNTAMFLNALVDDLQAYGLES